jgi:hypothetical protein
MGQGGLLLGVGDGEGEVRYRTSFLPKNLSGSGEVISAGTFQLMYQYYPCASVAVPSGGESLRPSAARGNNETKKNILEN